MAPQAGFEPATPRLTAECSTVELLRIILKSGSDLLSQGVTPQVPSALKGLPSVFGMRTGVSPSLLPPEIVILVCTFKTAQWISQIKPSTYQYRSAKCITALTPPAYLPRHLQGVLLHKWMGNLILRGASRLDAFSVYPVRTWLLSYAPGGTTDSPSVRPSRSSRTKDSSSQISYARDGQGPNCLTTF